MEEDVNELEEDVRRHQCVQKITKRKKYLRILVLVPKKKTFKMVMIPFKTATVSPRRMACIGSRFTVLASRIAFRAACVPHFLPTRAFINSAAMPPKSTQQGLGAFLKKGVKMVDHIKVDIPLKATADGTDKSASSAKRTSGRKRTTKAEADAKAATKAAKKPKKAGPSRDHERRCWDAGEFLLKLICTGN